MEQDKILSKFSSVAELEKAYVNLESEFTKRCKMLKDLQAENESLLSSIASATEQVQNNELLKSVQVDSADKDFIRNEQLESIATNSNFKVFGKGESVITPPKKPKTLQEANIMAKKFLNLKGEND